MKIIDEVDFAVPVVRYIKISLLSYLKLIPESMDNCILDDIKALWQMSSWMR